MAVDSESNLDRKFIQTMQLLNIYLNHFPSHEKHGLALRVRTTAYEVYDYIVESQKRYHKKTTLRTHSLQHLLNYAEVQNHELYRKLPKIYHAKHYKAVRYAGGISGVMYNIWGNVC